MAAKHTEAIIVDAPETKAATPCLCGAYEIEIGDDAETMEFESTHCHASTTRDFAPGHDAKLKSLLIRAGVAGQAVRYNQGGVAYISSAEEAASKLQFGYMILNGIKAGREKLAAKANKPARTRKSVVKRTQTPAKIKVGRWEYDAQINDQTQNATYVTSAGETKVAEAGRYKILFRDAK